MCDLVYLIVISIVLIICFLIIKKSKIVNKRRWFRISIVIVCLLYVFFAGFSLGAAVRIIFFVIIFIICLFVIKKVNIKKAKRIDKASWYAQSFAIACVSFILLCFVPFEDVFFTFSSPESAFRYSNSGDVIFVMEGEESAYVVGDECYGVFPKSDSGWKQGSMGDSKIIIHNISSDYNIYYYVEQYKDSEDYYIEVYDLYRSAVNITDNHNSEFYHLMETNDSSGETYHSYYVYVHDLDDEYTLIVNGEVIPLVNELN